MIVGWLVRIVVVIALVGALMFELGSPLITRVQLDDVAHEAANEAGVELVGSTNADLARAAAETVAMNNRAALKAFSIEPTGRVRVTVEREARSIVLKNWDRTKDWYDVEVSATSRISVRGR